MDVELAVKGRWNHRTLSKEEQVSDEIFFYFRAEAFGVAFATALSAVVLPRWFTTRTVPLRDVFAIG